MDHTVGRSPLDVLSTTHEVPLYEQRAYTLSFAPCSAVGNTFACAVQRTTLDKTGFTLPESTSVPSRLVPSSRESQGSRAFQKFRREKMKGKTHHDATAAMTIPAVYLPAHPLKVRLR